MPRRWLNVSKAFQKNPLVLETLQPTTKEMEQWYWMGIDDDITQGFVYAPPQDANPPVNPQTRKHKRRRTGTVQDEKLPKKLKPEKVKEVVVAASSISKSSPVKRTTPSQSRRSRSKSPLSPPQISSPEPIGAKDKISCSINIRLIICLLDELMESKGGEKKSSSSKSLFYEAPLGYSIEDVRPNGGVKKFRSAAYSNCSRKPS
ncbi:hypothetical protein Dimus_031203 [Dionaea muscipula]